MNDRFLVPKFEIATTAIIVNREGKFLLTKRSPNKHRFPSLWTVPGGHLEHKDYLEKVKPNRHGVYYGALVHAVRREVKEEVGLDIMNIRYVTDMVLDGGNVIVISFMADAMQYANEVKLNTEECTEYAWVTLSEATKYELIDGILDELRLADQILRGLHYVHAV